MPNAPSVRMRLNPSGRVAVVNCPVVKAACWWTESAKKGVKVGPEAAHRDQLSSGQ